MAPAAANALWRKASKTPLAAPSAGHRRSIVFMCADLQIGVGDQHGTHPKKILPTRSGHCRAQPDLIAPRIRAGNWGPSCSERRPDHHRPVIQHPRCRRQIASPHRFNSGIDSVPASWLSDASYTRVPWPHPSLDYRRGRWFEKPRVSPPFTSAMRVCATTVSSITTTRALPSIPESLCHSVESGPTGTVSPTAADAARSRHSYHHAVPFWIIRYRPYPIR